MPGSSTPRPDGQRSARTPELPPGFHCIQDIVDDAGPTQGQVVNIVGVVRDVQLPIPTHGTDFKSTMTLVDLSTQDSGDGVIFNIFRPKSEMPEVGCEDVVMLLRAKIQRYRGGALSLISNYGTSVFVYSSSKIPPAPRSAAVALQPSQRPRKRDPDHREHVYVSYLFQQIDKDILPTCQEFQARAEASLQIKDKFSLLQDVREDNFYDIIAQVAREPYDVGDKATLYVSDYTENNGFFHYTYEGIHELGGTSSNIQSSLSTGQWHGPYGKRAIQITVYEPHATFVRSMVKATQWVLIRNLHVKFGNNAANLEGYIREDRDATKAKLNIAVLDTQGDPEHIDPRLKEAVRRLREYKKQYKAELRKLEQATGMKRGVEEGEPDEDLDQTRKPNSKTRRKIKRQEAQRKEEEEISKKTAGLNKQILCESHGDVVSTVSQILEPKHYDTTINGQCQKLQLPFICAKYLANVRVVDFRPDSLERFAVSRKVNDFDMLSDNSDGSSTEDDHEGGAAGSDTMNAGRPFVWEWRFCLQLEDALIAKDLVKAGPERFWVVVDNAEGQYLTGMDASDLRSDSETLDRLRERMFTLWGDLEEHKARRLDQAVLEAQRRRGGPPALDSDGEEHSSKGEEAVSNTPFACCIRQYGVRVPEKTRTKADAGEGTRWRRVYGLFGTKISP